MAHGNEEQKRRAGGFQHAARNGTPSLQAVGAPRITFQYHRATIPRRQSEFKVLVGSARSATMQAGPGVDEFLRRCRLAALNQSFRPDALSAISSGVSDKIPATM